MSKCMTGTITKGTSNKLKYCLARIETILRVLLGQVRFVDLSEEDKIVLLPFMRAHAASSQETNIAYVEELDKVLVMSKGDPLVMFLVSEDLTVDVLREYSESGLAVRRVSQSATAVNGEPRMMEDGE